MTSTDYTLNVQRGKNDERIKFFYRNFRGDSNTVGQVISQATYTLCWNAFTK